MRIQNALYRRQKLYIYEIPQKSKNTVLGDIGRQLKAKLFYSQTNLNCIVHLPNEHSQIFDFEERN